MCKVETPRILKYTTSSRQKKTIVAVPPFVLALISEILGERLPTFMFTSRTLFKQTLQGQLQVYEMQRLSILNQIVKLENQVNDDKVFRLSQQSLDEFMVITQSEWLTAVKMLPKSRPKDITILKLYFTCLDKIENLDIENENFLLKVQRYMSSRPLPDCLEPQNFNMTRENCEKVRGLLLKLQ